MKRILISILLVLSIVFGLVACNETPAPSGGNEGGNSQTGNNTDGGNTDGGNTDGGNTDGGNTDGGNTDGGNTDGGNTDGGMSENEKIQLKAYLSTLLESYHLDPYSYLPESMTPAGKHLSSANAIVTDYSGFVNTSNIMASGFGEQWNMILENIAESQIFYRALEVVEGLITTSVTVFNNYLDNNPDATASHTFQSGIYNVTIYFEDGVLFYVLDYTANIPVLGTQTAQIALALDVETNEKTVRVQLGDANALCYTVFEDGYTFAIRYLGVRRAFFSVARDGEDVTGHIYEYLTVAGVELASAADFYVSDGYVSAVGNKADGLIGFKGYISELYDLDTGKLLGYEVRETLSALTYDTLWFDLSSLSGINSIKYRAKTDSTDAAFFINGKSTPWTPKKPLIGSRHYDIEFRTQYFYVYNAAEEAYEVVAAQVPMFFIQEQYYDDLTDEVSDKNDVTVTSRVNAVDLDKLLSDYDILIDVFIANKDLVTVDVILGLIGNKITH